ncbi:FAD-dependent oxidoreductase, partial [Candidatus Latescibacterota bacterium]
MIVLSGEKTKPVDLYDADFVIIGGGLGGIAAAISICSSARTVILIEETDRITGCFSYQDTSIYNEHRFVETSGTSKTYQTFRAKIRDWYKKNARVPPQLFSGLYSDIADFNSDNFCFETEAALDVINEMLEESVERGRLTVLKRHKVAKIINYKDRITGLHTIDLDKLQCDLVTGWIVIDATRTGYILHLAGAEYFIGMESKNDTGEPHAPPTADSLSVQKFYYGVIPELIPGSEKNKKINVSDISADKPDNTERMVRIPYLRKPRRIKAKTRIVEQDISASFQKGPRAKFFSDSVGIG